MQKKGLTNLAFHKFKRSFWGVISFCFISFVGFISLFAYVIAPDSSQYSNQMHLSIHSKPPGFTVPILVVPNSLNEDQNFFNRIFFGDANPATEIPISTHRFDLTNIYYTTYASDDLKGLENSVEIPLNSPMSSRPFVTQRMFYFGTDKYGRDLLSRILVGARISFSIGFVAVFISLLIGVFLGSIAGYFGGKWDAVIMWVINVTWSIPTLLLVIAITLALGKGFWQVFIAVGLTMWVEVARIVRGQVMSVKEMQYVTAARALGFTDFRIIVKHILPNILAPVIVISAANFAAAILIESGLSFLGIGAQPPMSS